MNIRPMLLAATFLAAPFAAHAATIDGPYIGVLAGANFAQNPQVNRTSINGTAINLGNTGAFLNGPTERLATGFRTGAYARNSRATSSRTTSGAPR